MRSFYNVFLATKIGNDAYAIAQVALEIDIKVERILRYYCDVLFYTKS